MYKRFYPDFKFNSIADIGADFFATHNLSFAVLDIDNTLVSYKTEYVDERAKSFLSMLSGNGIKYAFVLEFCRDSQRCLLFDAQPRMLA